MTIVKNNPKFDVKLAAVDAELASKASSERKASIARAALRLSIDQFSSEVAKNGDILTLRKRALSALIESADKDPTSADILRDLIALDKNNDESFDQTLTAYTALGFNGSDAAANLLNSKLEYYNDRQRSKINTPRDKILVRELIASMQRTKNKLVKPLLDRSVFVDWDTSINHDIQNAIKALQ